MWQRGQGGGQRWRQWKRRMTNIDEGDNKGRGDTVLMVLCVVTYGAVRADPVGGEGGG